MPLSARQRTKATAHIPQKRTIGCDHLFLLEEVGGTGSFFIIFLQVNGMKQLMSQW